MAGIKAGVDGQINNNIQTDGLVFYYDAAYTKSYPIAGGEGSRAIGSDVTAYNLASGSLTPHITLVNTPTYIGYPTASFNLDGVSDFIRIASDAKFNELGTGPWSFGIFMKKTETTTGGQYDGIFYLNSSNRMKFQASDQIVGATIGGTDHNLFDYGSSMMNTWYQIHASRENNGNVLAYVNGVLKGTVDYSGDSFTVAGTLMELGHNGDYTGAQIATVMFYNRALSAGDVLQNYNAQKDRFGL